MGMYRFPLSLGVGERVMSIGPRGLPSLVSVMYAGELVCEARLEQDAYTCDLPEEFAAKLRSGRLDQVFIYEPPLVRGREEEESVRRELVSILLVGTSRKGPAADE